MKIILTMTQCYAANIITSYLSRFRKQSLKFYFPFYWKIDINLFTL